MRRGYERRKEGKKSEGKDKKNLCLVSLCTTEYEILYNVIGGVTGITMTVHSQVL